MLGAALISSPGKARFSSSAYRLRQRRAVPGVRLYPRDRCLGAHSSTVAAGVVPWD